jgi:AhpD family alkylhydroperoxidase
MERILNQELPQGLIAAMRQVQAYINQSGLDKGLLELMRLRVSQLNGCAFCIDMHYKEAINAGESALRLISVSAWKEAPYYSEKERAVLAFAESLTLMHKEYDMDALHCEMGSFFSKHEIANLSLAVAQINSWNRLMKSFGTVAGNYTPAPAVK